MALYGIGDKQRWPVVIGRVKGLDQRLGAMATKVGHQPAQRFIIKTVD